MRVIVFGDYTKWEAAVGLLEKYRPDISIIGCCDPFRDQLSELFKTAYSMQETGDMFNSGEIDGVIVADASKRELNDFLEECGIKNYAIGSRYYRMAVIDDAEIPGIVQPYGNIRPELSQIEFHLADHCNLNCAGCAHFSNLVREPVFADFEQFSKDIRRLNELFDYVSSFYLLGGEPLLNPDITDFMYELRMVMPHTLITVVSNGLLVLTMEKKLITAFKETGAKLSISNYNCLDTDKITSFLDGTGIDYEIRYGRDFFAKYLTRTEENDLNDVFKRCANRKCHFLDKGRMAVCGQPFYIKYFNDYFGESFSDGGWISLYEDGIDGNEILRRMSKPMDACKNCTYLQPVEWRRTEGNADIKDWLV